MNRLFSVKWIVGIAVVGIFSILSTNLKRSAFIGKLAATSDAKTASNKERHSQPKTVALPESIGSNSGTGLPTRSVGTAFPAFAGALEAVRAEKDDLKREKALENLADAIKQPDFPGVMQILRAEENKPLSQELSLRILRRWAVGDPMTASSWLLDQPGGLASKQQAINTIAITWASQDLSAALGWVSGLSEEKSRDSAFVAVAYERARTSPLEALDWAAKLTPGDTRDALILHAARQWAATAPEDAAAWAGRIEASPLQQRVLAGIAADWAKTDAEAAANFAVKSLEAGKLQDDAVVGIVQRWVQSEPEKAASWVTQFPEGTMRDAALENLVKLWADKDPAQLGHWLNKLEASPSRDLAVATFVEKLALITPASAANWAENIGDASLRLENMERLGEDWMARDPASARAWISGSALPEATKARLLALQVRN